MDHAELSPRIPERHKRAGLCYALSDEGIELPVIDISHPAFWLEPGEEELAALQEEALGDLRRRASTPALVQGILLKVLLRGSLLAGAIGGARGGHVSGLGTYLLKLGPGNLGRGYAKVIDRRIAASFPCLSARLRLRDTARLLAESLVPALEAGPGARLHILYTAGGSAASTLNALLLLRRGHPDLLEGRPVLIQVLDLDRAGPVFAARSLRALMAETCPLAGLDLALEAKSYDWGDSAGLGEILAGLLAGPGGGEAILALVAEGGLFDYGSDGDVGANLLCPAQAWPGEALWVGSMSRAEGKARTINEASGAALRFRSPSDLARLSSASGWMVAKAVDAPLSSSFLLRREPGPVPA